MAATRRTVVFVKHPEPGRVKTRLAPALGFEGAAELAEAMLEDLVARLGTAPDLAVGIAFSPERAAPWFREHFGAIARFAQRGDGLAARMRAFFEERRRAAPGETVVILGADTPLAPIAGVRAAHEHLERGADVVLGPDAGGGYWLLGLRRVLPELFDVPMSTRGMCAETIATARRAGLAVEIVEPCFDVDEPVDLERLRTEIAALDARAAGYPRHTADFLARSSES